MMNKYLLSMFFLSMLVVTASALTEQQINDLCSQTGGICVISATLDKQIAGAAPLVTKGGGVNAALAEQSWNFGSKSFYPGVCSKYVEDAVVQDAKEYTDAARKKGRPAPSAQEAADLLYAMIRTEHQASKGESLGRCPGPESFLEKSGPNHDGTYDYGIAQINTVSIHYPINTNPDLKDPNSVYNLKINLGLAMSEILNDYKIWYDNKANYPQSYPAVIGAMYNRGPAGAKRGGDPYNYAARFTKNLQDIEERAS